MTPLPRIALVTGAGSGIGLAVATDFVRQGHRTLMLDRAPEVADIAARLGGGAEGMVVDVSQPAQIAEAMQSLERQHGRCDILVNNAGVHPKRAGGKFTIEDIELSQWQQVVAINLTAPFLLTQLALPLMRPQRWGRIVNISSRGGRTASPVASAHYSATKAGLIGFTRTLALEAAPDNITANCIAPGPVKSAMTAGSSPQVIEAFTRAIPLGRYGEPEEVASAVAYLASDAASFITGAVFDINGGTFMP